MKNKCYIKGSNRFFLRTNQKRTFYITAVNKIVKMSSVGYCFNICQTIDKNIVKERRTSISDSQTSTNLTKTGTLIFGRRFSLSHLAQPIMNLSSQSQNDPSSTPSSPGN
ncbi:unnamed protein product [Rotaria socialis]